MPGHSAEYVRTQSRNASTDADAVFYNPAGLAFMGKNGLSIMISSQSMYLNKKISFNLWGHQGTDIFNNAPPWSLSPVNSRYMIPETYPSSQLFPILPDLDIIYKRKNWAVFSYFAMLQLPGLTYNQGLPSLDLALISFNEVLATILSQQLANVVRASSIKRKEMHLSGTIGGSYAFTGWMSQSLAFRYININANTRLSQLPLDVGITGGTSLNSYQYPLLIDTDIFGNGFGIIVGFDFKPLDGLNIGTRLEYYPPMILTKRTNKFIAHPTIAQSGQLNIFCSSIRPLVLNDMVNPNNSGNILNFATMDPGLLKNIGNKFKVTYPPSVSVGLSYNILKNLRIESSADLTFPRARDLDGRQNDWEEVGYRLGQCVEWAIIPMLLVSVGYSYNDFGIKPEKRTEYNDPLTSHTMGAGCTVKAADWVDLTVGGFYSFLIPSSNRGIDFIRSTISGIQYTDSFMRDQKLSGNQYGISIGITFSFSMISVDNRKKAEDHYWKGMASYLYNDIDTAIKEFKTARDYNPEFTGIDKKIQELEEIQTLIEKNKKEEKREEKRQ
ncbi:MAG: hypothetical protein A2W19_02065 [Spirochaetes bacterium RBG_16_49_21]|nr:MAG: hypothetical protein A2W19_02065 [Spirochaetes bacterium RBG_16_49_21]